MLPDTTSLTLQKLRAVPMRLIACAMTAPSAAKVRFIRATRRNTSVLKSPSVSPTPSRWLNRANRHDNA
jgi:hypothetical protein